MGHPPVPLHTAAQVCYWRRLAPSAADPSRRRMARLVASSGGPVSPIFHQKWMSRRGASFTAGASAQMNVSAAEVAA